MPSSLLTEWQAYFAEEPWGEERADLRMAIGWALLANVHRDQRRRPEPYKPSDFMPYTRRELARENPQRLWERLMRAFGRIENGRKRR